MDWLFAPMPAISGPAFLVIYFLIAVVVVVLARERIAATDPSRDRNVSTAPVEVDRDPYEIAYLRGGANELLRFTVFDLVRLGRLVIVDPDGKQRDKAIVAAESAGEGSPTALQRAVLDFYAAPHTSKELFASSLPATAASFALTEFEPHLRRDRMLAGLDAPAAQRGARGLGLLVLLSLAAYRLAFAMIMHHAAAFLVIEVLFAVVALIVATKAPRLSAYGRSYLRRLATAVRPRSVAPIAVGLGMLPIAVAATGFDALAGTPYAPLDRAFPRSSASDGSGGCGGGFDSSSDGGGGGGGCGGGGCGG